MEYPEHILRRLRGRAGLELDDTSKDERLKLKTPREALRDCVGWELGDGEWANVILGWAEDCGLVITSPKSTD